MVYCPLWSPGFIFRLAPDMAVFSSSGNPILLFIQLREACVITYEHVCAALIGRINLALKTQLSILNTVLSGIVSDSSQYNFFHQIRVFPHTQENIMNHPTSETIDFPVQEQWDMKPHPPQRRDRWWLWLTGIGFVVAISLVLTFRSVHYPQNQHLPYCKFTMSTL